MASSTVQLAILKSSSVVCRPAERISNCPCRSLHGAVQSGAVATHLLLDPGNNSPPPPVEGYEEVPRSILQPVPQGQG
ncbi:hypothetical protein E2C01_006251 [Portunus trituberculatus]|uniref:Uncharacterized protein n=1 Tax=Portunus trituberculatus TaxID=210409 RepID=A0A5B7CXN1_PORTR|nr:hypothetical protein [Portunus trituberculatus]